MAKKKGTKHHVVIKMEDLNKMFNGQDVIPVPKGFVKRIEFLLSSHNVSIADIPKDTGLAPSIEPTPVAESPSSEGHVQIVETDFEA
jgi:hypothetical protein